MATAKAKTPAPKRAPKRKAKTTNKRAIAKTRAHTPEPAPEPAPDTPSGMRRPKDEDLGNLLWRMSEGASLRAACRAMGMDHSSTHVWLHEDEGRRQQYARAKELRGEHYQEEGLTVTRAAALGLEITNPQDPDGPKIRIDPKGARVYLEAIKWSVGRMAPKSIAPIPIHHTGNVGHLSDAEIAAAIAALEEGRDVDLGEGEDD